MTRFTPLLTLGIQTQLHQGSVAPRPPPVTDGVQNCPAEAITLPIWDNCGRGVHPSRPAGHRSILEGQ